MAKRPAALRAAIPRLWSAAAEERLAALSQLYEMASLEMVDIRTAQPGVVVCLADDDLAVRRRAIDICEWRADMGADIGLAVPALLTMQDDPDPETRALVRRALHHANQRLKGLLTADLHAPEQP